MVKTRLTQIQFLAAIFALVGLMISALGTFPATCLASSAPTAPAVQSGSVQTGAASRSPASAASRIKAAGAYARPPLGVDGSGRDISLAELLEDGDTCERLALDLFYFKPELLSIEELQQDRTGVRSTPPESVVLLPRRADRLASVHSSTSPPRLTA